MMATVRLDHRGEFDELFVGSAEVHIERMNTRAFWIGIDVKDGPTIHINTGIANGKWFFRVEDVDTESGGISEVVERPACHRSHKGPGK